MKKILVFLAVVTIASAVAAACGTATPTATLDGESPQAQLILAKSRWERSGITSYTYTTAQQCFCPQDYVAPVVVDVRDGV